MGGLASAHRSLLAVSVLLAGSADTLAQSYPSTVGETLPGILVSAWYGVQVPAGTPREIITRLNADIVKAVTTEKVARSIIAAGLEPVTNSPEEFAAYIRSQTAVWGKVVKDAGIRIE